MGFVKVMDLCSWLRELQAMCVLSAMDIMWIMYSEWAMAALHGLVHAQIDEVVCEFNTSTNNLVF